MSVTWLHTASQEQAVWKNSMLASQDTAAKVRQKFTIDQVTEEFGIKERSVLG